MKTASKFCIVLVTAGDRKNAFLISKLLTKNKLVACVNILPSIRSIYRWKGKIENAAEILMLIKTRKSNLSKLEKIIRQHHTYEIPEILTISLLSGEARYLHWLNMETRRR